MKIILTILSMLILTSALSAYYFWDFETNPWTDGWSSAKRDQGVNWPRRWEWRTYDQEGIRPLDPLTMTMWICSNRAGNFVLRDTLYSPKLTDSLYYTQWLKYTIGYRYRAGRDEDTASVIIRRSVAGAWTSWQQLQFYFGTNYSIWDSIDIMPLARGSDSIQIAFAYRGGGGAPLRPDYYFGVDNVSVRTVQGGSIPGPTISPVGTDSGLTEIEYIYTSELVPGNYEYQFSWGDGTYSDWDISNVALKSWNTPGTYFVSSRIRDALDSALYSNWSPPLYAVMVTPRTAYYWGFEVDDAGFVGLYQLGDWQWGIPNSGPFMARSGANVWGTRLNDNYQTNASWLNSPEMDISMCDSVKLYFWMWYDSRLNYDGVNLWVGSDSFTWGLSNYGYYWDTVPSANIIPVYTGSYNVTWTGTTMPGWTGSSPLWTLYEVELTPYRHSQDLRLLWRLGDNDGTTQNRAGFYIDDVRLDTAMLIPGPVLPPTGPDTCITFNSEAFISDVVPGSYEYQFDWGDGTFSGWDAASVRDKAYDEVGTYYVRSRVRDAGDTTRLSAWSPAHVTVALHNRTVKYWGFEFPWDTAGFYLSGDWEQGVPLVGPSTARSGYNVMATDLDGIHQNNGSWLTLPGVDVSFSDSAVMYFWMWYDSRANIDGVNMFYGSASLTGGWSNLGIRWDTVPQALIEPVYTGTFNVSWTGSTMSGWTGSAASWTLYSVNLTPLKNYTDLRFTWRLADNSGTTANGPGFYIDDIRVDTFMMPITGPLNAPWGPGWGYINTNYSFLSDSAISSFGTLEYQFDWGDGSYSSWNTDRNALHQWSLEGLFPVRTRARVQSDTTLMGGWSPAHYIEIGVTGYFDAPWTFEPGNQGWKVSPVWERKSSTWYSGWNMPNSDNWSMWAIGTGEVYVCDTTFSPSAPVAPDQKYISWTACLRSSTSVAGDTAIVIFRTFRNTVWGDWNAAYFYTARTSANWFYKEVPQLEGADSVQVGVIYVHRDGTTDTRFFGIDNVWILNRPFLTEIVWNFEDQSKWDWTHTVTNNWPNGWNIRSSSTVSSLQLASSGSYSAWIGRTSSHNVPLVDTIISPAEWNPINLQYFVWGIGFNNAYDSIEVLMCGMKEGVWSPWFTVKTYLRATTPSFRDLDSADVSDSFAGASKIEVAFVYYSRLDFGACVIDNIRLSSSDSKDAFVSGGNPNIQGEFLPSGTNSVRATVKNNGYMSADFTARAVITDIGNGSVLMNETRDITGLTYLDSAVLDFGDVSLVEDHHYVRKIIIEYPGDENPGNDTSFTSIRCFSPSWEKIADMPVSVSGAVAWFDGDGDLNVFGDSLHMVFDVLENTWSVKGYIPYRIQNAQGVQTTDRIYIWTDEPNLRDKLVVFDKLSGVFGTVNLPNGIASPTIAGFSGVGGDYLYVAESDLTGKPDCYLYDENAERFMTATPLPGGFEGGTAVGTKDGIVYAGGDIYGGNVFFGKVNPASPTVINWSTDYMTPLIGKEGISGGSSGRFIVFAGGRNTGAYSPKTYLFEDGYGWYEMHDLQTAVSDASLVSRETGNSSDSVEVFEFYMLGGRNASGNTNESYRLVLKTSKRMNIETVSGALPGAYGFFIGLASSNVFKDGVSLRLSLPGSSNVRWTVYDVTGRQIRNIETYLPTGLHVLSWDGRDDAGYEISSGTYFWMMQTDFGSENGKLLRVR